VGGARQFALVELRDNPDVRVVILVGAGDKAFVSGADISQFEKTRHNAAASEEYSKRSEAQRALLADYPKPTIACIRGFCLGGGMQVAMLTDIRIAADNSQFGIPAAKLGIAYGYDGLKHLVSLVGPSWARLIMYTGMRIDSAEACGSAWSTACCPDAELWDATMEIARTISGNAPLAIKAAKITIAQVLKDESKRDMDAIKADRHRLHGLEDFREGRTRLHGKAQAAVQGEVMDGLGHHARIPEPPKVRGGAYDARLSYSAASTALAISAVPLLPPNSIGLMPSA
jgi:enoyl-CoA hydratase